MTRQTLPSVSEYTGKALSWAYVANAIVDGLMNGKPFAWGVGEWKAYNKKAETMGFTLCSKTKAARMGYTIKQSAKPIGTAAMGGSRFRGFVYILERHFTPPAAVQHGVQPPAPAAAAEGDS